MPFGEQFLIFSSIAVAIFLEAMPFLALGALLSALIEVYVPPEKLLSRIPKSRAAGIGLGVAAGMVLPTCECGVVPIARRLLRKGVPAHVAISYMAAAPIINPIVLVSTFIAFRFDPAMVLGRAIMAGVVAAALGIFAGRMPKVLANGNGEAGHEHSHDHGTQPTGGRGRAVMVHAAHEFVDMARYLILGALVAAAFKTFMPQGAVSFFDGSLVLSISGMMLLAVLLSICSEADAFVAASFVTFPAAARLAFVVIGPVVDLKLIGMYAATFNRRLVVGLLVIPTVLVFVLSLIWGWLV